jgi:hypothetical protein
MLKFEWKSKKVESPKHSLWSKLSYFNIQHSTFNIFFVAFLLSRVAIGIWALQNPSERMFNGDSALYEQYALSMLETGEYLAPGYAGTDPWADMIRPPGYPLLIAAVYAVLGTGFWGKVGLLLLNLGGAVALWMGVGRLCRGASHAPNMKEGGCHPPLHVALILILDLGLLLFSKEILTELLFAPMIVWMVVGIRGALAGRITDAPVSMRPSILLGLATLLKPITFYLPWVMIPLLRYLGWDWKRIAGFTLIAAGIPFLWQARNFAEHGTFAYTSIAAENLMTGHATFVLSAVEGYSHSQSIDTVRARYLLISDPADGFTQISEKKTRIAKEILFNHPIVYGIQIAKGMVFTLLDPGREVWERTFGKLDESGPGITETIARDGVWKAGWRIVSEYPFLVLYIGFLIVVYGMSVRGFIRLWHEDRKLFVVLMVLISYFLVLGGPIGYARFRLYILPLALGAMFYVRSTKRDVRGDFVRSAKRDVRSKDP